MRRAWSAGLVCALALGTGSIGVAYAHERGGDDSQSPIKHTIILYQENISFDHYFGTYGHGSNGIPEAASLVHTSSTGQTFGPFEPTALSGLSQGQTCDVDHGYADMIKMANHGAMNQYLQFGNNLTVSNPSSNKSATCQPFETAVAPGTKAQALANSYYTGTKGKPDSPLQNYWRLASQYTLADNFFQGIYGPSTPGAEWLVAATANTVHDPNPIGDTCNDYPASISPQNIPNLGQEATALGVSWAWFQGGFGSCSLTNANGYSAHHNPFQYFTSTADLNHAHAFDPQMDSTQANQHQRDLSVFDAALAGTALPGQSVVPVLPAISWVKAPAVDDGHPAYSGPVMDDMFVGDLVSRLKASQYWKDTALFVAFDETGGWWDHVSPPDLGGKFGGKFATWVNGSPNLTGCQYPGDAAKTPCGEAGFGPRMPVLVISKFARRGFVDHNRLDTSSLVKWVEWNHQLPSLGVWGNRDVNAGSLTSAFRFGEQDNGGDSGGGGQSD